MPSASAVPEWAGKLDGFYSVTRTPDELSIVCAQELVPAGVQASRGWACLKLLGPFPFSETGVLSSFIAPLAEAEIGIFAIATYDTDYILIEETFLTDAVQVLQAAGHQKVSDSAPPGRC